MNLQILQAVLKYSFNSSHNLEAPTSFPKFLFSPSSALSYCFCLTVSSNSLSLSRTLAPLQWNTSRRCRPSLRAQGPLVPASPGTPPPPHPRGALSSHPLRWRSPASSRWRCARCHENSAPRTQKTGMLEFYSFVWYLISWYPLYFLRKKFQPNLNKVAQRKHRNGTSTPSSSYILFVIIQNFLYTLKLFSSLFHLSLISLIASFFRLPFCSPACFSLCFSSSHLICQVFWGNFIQQKELCVPASKRPSHGSVLVQCHPGWRYKPFTTSEGGDEDHAAWHGGQTSGLDYRAGMQKYRHAASILQDLHWNIHCCMFFCSVFLTFCSCNF